MGTAEKPGHDNLGIPRLSTEAGSKVEILSKLILPYGYPSRGFVDNEDFASIHSSPPWETTPFPGAVPNAYGTGSALYWVQLKSASSRQRIAVHYFHPSTSSRASQSGSPNRSRHWTTTSHQPNKSRYVVRALNYNIDYMPDLTKISFTLNVPEISKISSVGGGKKVDITRQWWRRQFCY